MYRTINDALLEQPAESWLLPGLSTGFAALDRALGGITPGEMILITARTGHYGRILTENLAAGLARNGPVLYLTADRKACAAAKELQAVLMPPSEEERQDDELMDHLNRQSRNLYFDEAVFPEEIEAAVAGFRAAFPLDAAVVVDCLNGLLLSKEPVGYSREAEEGRIADNLKRLALKHSVPVLLYARTGPAAATGLMHLAEWGERFDRVVGVCRPGKAHPGAEQDDDASERRVFLHVLKGRRRGASTVTLSVSEENRFVLVSGKQ